MKFLETKEIPIGQVKPNSYNPNRMSGGKFKLLKDYLKEYGPLGTIWVRPKGEEFEIIDGEQRWKAYQDLGFEKIRCDVIDVDDVDARYLTLAANEIRGEHDSLKEGEVLKFLADSRSVEEVLAKTIHSQEDVERLIELIKAGEQAQGDALKSVQFDAKQNPPLRLSFEFSGERQKVVSEALNMTSERDQAEGAWLIFQFYFKNYGRMG